MLFTGFSSTGHWSEMEFESIKQMFPKSPVAVIKC